MKENFQKMLWLLKSKSFSEPHEIARFQMKFMVYTKSLDTTWQSSPSIKITTGLLYST